MQNTRLQIMKILTHLRNLNIPDLKILDPPQDTTTTKQGLIDQTLEKNNKHRMLVSFMDKRR